MFRKKGDFEAFLKALADLKQRQSFELYGYCLLSNHFHLLIRPAETSISRIMQSLFVSHTQRYHRNHRSGGHVWQGRFKSPVIQDDEHLLTVLRYIEANPLRRRRFHACHPCAESVRWVVLLKPGTVSTSALGWACPRSRSQWRQEPGPLLMIRRHTA